MSEIKQTSTTASSADVEKTSGDLPKAIDASSMRKHIDNNDPDDALKLVGGEVVVLTPEDERRLLKKIDRNMMPLLCIVYGLNYLDKTTLSYASIMGIKVRFAIPNLRLRLTNISYADRS